MRLTGRNTTETRLRLYEERRYDSRLPYLGSPPFINLSFSVLIMTLFLYVTTWKRAQDIRWKIQMTEGHGLV